MKFIERWLCLGFAEWFDWRIMIQFCWTYGRVYLIIGYESCISCYLYECVIFMMVFVLFFRDWFMIFVLDAVQCELMVYKVFLRRWLYCIIVIMMWIFWSSMEISCVKVEDLVFICSWLIWCIWELVAFTCVSFTYMLYICVSLLRVLVWCQYVINIGKLVCLCHICNYACCLMS
jgi:hypothetical protein